MATTDWPPPGMCYSDHLGWYWPGGSPFTFTPPWTGGSVYLDVKPFGEYRREAMGWVCPKCGAVNAPGVVMCPCSIKHYTGTTTAPLFGPPIDTTQIKIELGLFRAPVEQEE